MKTKTWKLPKPPSGPVYEWYPIVRIGRMVPFGYYEDPDDKDILQPIPKELELLEKAKGFLKEFPAVEVANWLSEQSGRYISGPGLRKRISIEQKNRKQASIAEFYAERYKEAAEKARKLQEERLGGSKTYRIVSE